MTEPRDGWDANERDALHGLEDELAEVRARHADDPSVEMLRAADANALPPELQSHVEAHLQSSAWSRALVDGLRDVPVDDQLDAETEQRIYNRVVAAAAPARSWRPMIIAGGLALAASALIAVLLPRPVRDAEGPAEVEQPSPPAPVLIAFNKPEVKLSSSALTWRGGDDNPFLRDLAPAFEAYRRDDVAAAADLFDALATRYPDAIEVLFYLGVSRLLAGNAAGAVAPLESAVGVAGPTFADDVPWYLAVAQQRSGRPEARERFAALCGAGGRYAADACAAVSQLDQSSRR